jgi:hypothetical protein
VGARWVSQYWMNRVWLIDTDKEPHLHRELCLEWKARFTRIISNN